MVWKRAGVAFPNASLFGKGGVSPDDLRQGFIGNCWFIAAAAALAETPGRAEKIFLNLTNEQSPNGIYGVNIFTLGMPHTVIIDDYLPLNKFGGDKLMTMYAKVSEENALFGPLLEKVVAKRFGNYEHTIAGLPSKAVRMLTGAPYEEFMHKNLSMEAVWKLLSSADEHDDFITAGTEGAGDD